MTQMKEMTREEFKFTPECFKQLFLEASEDINENEGTIYDHCAVICGAIGFTTYNSAMDVRVVQDFIDVIQAILDGKTYEYLEQSEKKHLNYLTVVNLHNIHQFLNWGTSIRGAWFEEAEETSIGELFICHPVWLSDMKFDSREKVETAFRGLVMFFDEYIKPDLQATLEELDQES